MAAMHSRCVRLTPPATSAAPPGTATSSTRPRRARPSSRPGRARRERIARRPGRSRARPERPSRAVSPQVGQVPPLAALIHAPPLKPLRTLPRRGRSAPRAPAGSDPIGTVFHFVWQAVQTVAANSGKAVFPGVLVLIVLAFLSIQGRIDRNDPKLALAPEFADPALDFGPPPSME